MKNYAIAEDYSENVRYTRSVKTTNTFYMEGTVHMEMYTGSNTSWPVWKGTWDQENGVLTKKDIWDNVNDDGCGGAKSYLSCEIDVYQVAEVTYTPYDDAAEVETTTEAIKVFSGRISKKDLI